MMRHNYQPPVIRNILLGVLLFIFGLVLLGHLGELVKSVGYLFFYPLDKLGLLKLVTKDEVWIVDMSLSNQTVVFGIPGQYAFYTSNLDLLQINDAILDKNFKPWMKIQNLKNGEQIKVEFIQRGLMIYDTPFAKGRPILTFLIPSTGQYRIQNATQPGAIGYFVRDYVTGNEYKYILLFLGEICLICVPIAWLGFQRARQRIIQLKTTQKANKKRADALQALLKQKNKHSN